MKPVHGLDHLGRPVCLCDDCKRYRALTPLDPDYPKYWLTAELHQIVVRTVHQSRRNHEHATQAREQAEEREKLQP